MPSRTRGRAPHRRRGRGIGRWLDDRHVRFLEPRLEASASRGVPIRVEPGLEPSSRRLRTRELEGEPRALDSTPLFRENRGSPAPDSTPSRIETRTTLTKSVFAEMTPVPRHAHAECGAVHLMPVYIRYLCPNCSQNLNLRLEYVNRRVVCKFCKHQFFSKAKIRVPASATPDLAAAIEA